MTISIALAGNPNSGKTTLFNQLTGSHQYVGNWPGVTVEKKTGEYKKDKEVKFTDLPGTYSLSPYSLEEVIARDFLVNERPDVIIGVVDASNIERNLYLSTQLSELGIPLVLALNMMDVVEKRGDKIDTRGLEESLNCRIVEISALKNKGLDELIQVASEEAHKDHDSSSIKAFSDQVESYIRRIEEGLVSLKDEPAKRWMAIKLFEGDKKLTEDMDLSADEMALVLEVIKEAEEALDDDTEGIITDERYEYVTGLSDTYVKKGQEGLSTSDKADRILTNRILALPIFVVIMAFVYKLSIDWAGGWPVEILEGYIIEPFTGLVETLLASVGASEAISSLVIDGAIAGVAGVIGFLPLIAVLFFCIAVLEDVGYMARIAFILDRAFRRFGLSGKSFIPILIGTGCSVPGIVGTRTIENDRDRRLTITVASMMPCGAKTDVIAMFAGVFGGSFWFGPIWYFGGIAAVIVSGLILKKTARFQGDPSPFVMELPDYHFPSMSNVLRSTWTRVRAFIVKAGTIILLSSIAIWLLQNITITGEFAAFGESEADSILAFAGKKIEWIFAPLGFGDWMAAVATVLGLVAKEVVVATFSILANLGGAEAGSAALNGFVASYFTTASMLSFMFYNQFTIPCFAALGAIREEMNDKGWFAFAVGYILVFSYTISLMIYQFARVLIDKQAPNAWTILALVILAIYLFLIFKPAKSRKSSKEGGEWAIS